MNEDVGPIMQINKFNVDPAEVDQFLKAFADTAEVLRNSLDLYIRSATPRYWGKLCIP